MLKKNKAGILLSVLLAGLLALLIAGWFLLAFFRFGPETRALLNDLTDLLAVKIRPVPPYFLPFPRHEVKSGQGSYDYGFVGDFRRTVEDNAVGGKTITSSRAVLKTLSGEEKEIDVYDPAISFNFLASGWGLFLKQTGFAGGAEVSRRSRPAGRALFFKAENLRFNLRAGDFVQVVEAADGSKAIFWYGTTKLFY
jgi:hypothetical protein